MTFNKLSSYIKGPRKRLMKYLNYMQHEVIKILFTVISMVPHSKQKDIDDRISKLKYQITCEG